MPRHYLIAVSALTLLAAAFALQRFASAADDKKERGQGVALDMWFLDLDTNRLVVMKGDAFPPTKAPSGGQAVKAYVFACGSCGDEADRFVGYYEKFTAEFKQMMERAQETAKAGKVLPDAALYMEEGYTKGRLISADGSNWVGSNSEEGIKLVTKLAVACDGGGRLLPCYPTAADRKSYNEAKPTRAWYYDLDAGKMFLASAADIPPIDAPSGGKGFLAHVYSCGACGDEKSRFTGYYEGWTQTAQEAGKRLAAKPDKDKLTDAQIKELEKTRERGRLVSAEGKSWYEMDSVEGAALLAKVKKECETRGGGKLVECHPPELPPRTKPAKATKPAPADADGAKESPSKAPPRDLFKDGKKG